MIAENKHADITRRIRDLTAMQGELAKLIDACRENINGQDRCAIIETLAQSRRR